MKVKFPAQLIKPHATRRAHSSLVIRHSFGLRHSSFGIPHRPSQAGFTMVEIAISLAVIGFALVAIIGILPIGMGLQKQNRQETIINQDASVFLDAIRNGQQGLDDLTNYVVGITNDVTRYDLKGAGSHVGTYGYGLDASSGFGGPQYPLTGYRIVGLLSTPKYVPYVGKGGGGYFSNHVVAYVRSVSGPASEKFPQKDASIEDLAFSYRLMPEVVTYGMYNDPAFYNPALGDVQPTDQPPPAALQANLHELRLTFRWPLVDSKGKAGPSQQSFRCEVGGWLASTNEVLRNNFAGYPGDAHTLYFFQPTTYVNTNSP
jgi:type II secretory pathway pseudopilin PulG